MTLVTLWVAMFLLTCWDSFFCPPPRCLLHGLIFLCLCSGQRAAAEEVSEADGQRRGYGGKGVGAGGEDPGVCLTAWTCPPLWPPHPWPLSILFEHCFAVLQALRHEQITQHQTSPQDSTPHKFTDLMCLMQVGRTLSALNVGRFLHRTDPISRFHHCHIRLSPCPPSLPVVIRVSFACSPNVCPDRAGAPAIRNWSTK